MVHLVAPRAGIPASFVGAVIPVALLTVLDGREGIVSRCPSATTPIVTTALASPSADSLYSS